MGTSDAGGVKRRKGRSWGRTRAAGIVRWTTSLQSREDPPDGPVLHRDRPSTPLPRPCTPSPARPPPGFRGGRGEGRGLGYAGRRRVGDTLKCKLYESCLFGRTISQIKDGKRIFHFVPSQSKRSGCTPPPAEWPQARPLCPFPLKESKQFSLLMPLRPDGEEEPLWPQ